MVLIYTNPASLGLSPFLLEERYREDSLLSELFILTDSRPDSLGSKPQWQEENDMWRKSRESAAWKWSFGGSQKGLTETDTDKDFHLHIKT